MNFQEAVKQHLSSYKKDILNISENGVFPTNGKLYSHILPLKEGQSKKETHTLESPLQKQIQSKIGDIKLHRFYHHLNSSQAACFNLFYPLEIKNELNVLAQYICPNSGQVKKKSLSCEYVPDSEEGTNVDAYFETDMFKFFIEFKYSENDFGSTKDRQSIQEKYHKIYKPRLAKLFLEPIEYNYFIKHYQIFRNLLLLGEHRFVVFIMPSKNVKLFKRLESVLTTIRFISPELVEQVKVIALEEILNLPYKSPVLLEHLNKYKEKYIF